MICINEIKLLPASACVTYRLSKLSPITGQHEPREALNPELRSEAYFVWDRSALLRTYTGGRTMHPADWQWEAAVWQPHAPIETILECAGYRDETPKADVEAA